MSHPTQRISTASFAVNGVAGPRPAPPGRPKNPTPSYARSRYGGEPEGSRPEPKMQSPGDHRRPKGKPKPDYRKTALSNAPGASASRSQAVPAKTPRVDPSQMIEQFTGMTIDIPEGSNVQMYNPSNGPSPSMMTVADSAFAPATESKGGGSTSGNAVRNRYCKTTKRTRTDFKRGTIITLPYHVPNGNPKVDPTDKQLTETIHGPVYSKRRMFIVLWIYERDMLCLPLFTHGGSGLAHQPKVLKKEYLCVVNPGDANKPGFENHASKRPLVADCHRKLLPNTYVRVTAGQKVACNEDIVINGRLNQDSFRLLSWMWKDLEEKASEEAW